jgi:hypothetical protein
MFQTLLAFTALLAVSCTPSASTKAGLQTADSIARDACEALAVVNAENLGVRADAIIAATCAVESVTRRLRDRLLAAQLQAVREAGLVASPPDPFDAPAAAPADYDGPTPAE